MATIEPTREPSTASNKRTVLTYSSVASADDGTPHATVGIEGLIGGAIMLHADGTEGSPSIAVEVSPDGTDWAPLSNSGTAIALTAESTSIEFITAMPWIRWNDSGSGSSGLKISLVLGARE